ncbi:MAG TPA: alpha/beta fold hydrolase [Verrucomicrobiae bacterium]|nr:alpha/beta fold hydrolase [Verrucomicrobiae bacterium]
MFGEIKNARGERIDYTFHAGDNAKPLVILGHGVTGNKDRPFVVALANALAADGFPALRISFSGNGASGGRFVDSNITKEVADLGSVIDAVGNRPFGYIGHSMGGAVGVLRASQDPRIKFLVSLAGMVHTKAFAQREFGMVKPGEGFMWDDENCPLSAAYMNDLSTLDTLVDRGPKIRVPWLLVHGSEDDVVPIQDSRDIFARANEPKQLIEIPGSNHVFAADHTATMIGHVLGWLKKLPA